ncbi:hypothetical protein HDU79_000530 [Rhizoclosmatium sp. JEL0117]|nr:hypothetical protein HDU79_000530 [Rhizoclosmatium sp. JEL0117]
MSSPTIVLHHLEDSRSIRIAWLLEELNVPYEIKVYKRLPSKLAPPELLQVHPLGKSPVIVDNSANPPFAVAESGAIIEYLTEKFPNSLVPARGTQEKVNYTYWLHASEGTLAPPLVMKVIFNETLKNVPFFISPIIGLVFNKISEKVTDPTIERVLAYLESELVFHKYAAGNEFTAADIQLYRTLRNALVYTPQFVGPKTKEWLELIRQRAAFKKVAYLDPEVQK